MHEFEFIRKLLVPLAASEKGALALSDDAAFITAPAGHEIVVTTDAMTQGIHFIGDESPDRIARKLLRVNLSDLAAMGAAPHSYFLALMLPETVNEQWLSSFTSGLAADQQAFGITLMGGDTTRSKAGLALSVTALGLVPKGEALLRSGAKPGDDIYVSGTIGDGALGLMAAQDKREGNAVDSDFLRMRYQLPEPRLALGYKLRGMATACMDISDGLMQDLGHICECSGAGATIAFESIPLSSAARAVLKTMDNSYEPILAGGDDYELLFTALPAMREKLTELSAELDLPLTRIGQMTEGNTAHALDAQRKEIILVRKGYQHF